MDATARKRNGVHYTPKRLAEFLAEKTVSHLLPSDGAVHVLDPSCGDGMLLRTFADKVACTANRTKRSSLVAHGFDIDIDAIGATRERLKDVPLERMCLQQADFLEFAESTSSQFDAVIANPPYVRTQVLGEAKSKELARRFELTGRVDLYHAFVAAINRVLKPGGVMGLLTSNRFLTTRAGGAMRKLLDKQFELRAIYDFGDTRLFDAAVLPAILVALKKPANAGTCIYQRVYQADFSADEVVQECGDLFQALEDDSVTKVSKSTGSYLVERGELLRNEGTWSLSNHESQGWLAQLGTRQFCKFGDVAEVKVGIKTTADSVFIREDWDEIQVEPELLCPLVTHHDAQRWISKTTRKSVLYPYDRSESNKRTVIDLESYPESRDYFESHRSKLSARKYVLDAGREWYEIWVAHQPADWMAPKIVWPDISERPRFFLDQTGAIVNGDCYWIKLKPGVELAWVYLMLAVANSEIAVRYYDTMFHNKLYAGRRRFMTQYVKEFPLPDLGSNDAQELVGLVKKMIDEQSICAEKEAIIESRVQRLFGFEAPE